MGISDDACPNCQRLEAQLAEVLAELSAIKARLGLDSTTSSQPPSKDKPWRTKSERQKSVRSSGAQVGHPGKTLKMAQQVDEVITLPVEGQCECGHAWDSVGVSGTLARQVMDLPELRLQVTEYRAEVKICPSCTHRQQAPFPVQVPGQVQYGPRLLGLATYLNAGHFVPLERTTEVLEALCGARLSDGTIVLNLNLAAERLTEMETQLKAALLRQSVLHADETGSKVNGKLQWMHVVSCKQLTLYGHHPKRGYAALEAMDVLPRFRGVLMHDAWASYFKLACKHALCNAHLLRELRGLHERYGQSWAWELREALRQVYVQQRVLPLTAEQQLHFLARFDELVQAGLDAHPASARIPGRRGRPKQHPGRNLAQRCQQHRCAMLRFLSEPDVPFDNNLAERDVRPWCVKRKVSGGFRSEAGGVTFCRLRSYISTLRKQGLNVWHGLVSIFQGNVMMPDFSC